MNNKYIILSTTFRDAFAIFDRDKDGFIDLKELKNISFMLGFKMEIEELEEALAEVDLVI